MLRGRKSSSLSSPNAGVAQAQTDAGPSIRCGGIEGSTDGGRLQFVRTMANACACQSLLFRHSEQSESSEVVVEGESQRMIRTPSSVIE